MSVRVTADDARILAAYASRQLAWDPSLAARVVTRERALGVVLLIDDASASAMTDLDTYLTAFGDFFSQSRAVVGITRADVGAHRSADPYQSRLGERGLALPVFVRA